MAPQRFAWGITVMIVFAFGASLSSAISSSVIGGQDPGSWPWHVAFTDNGDVRCLGSLITDQWVLTSAYCLIGFNLRVVYLGAYNQSEYGKVTGGVDSTHCHPDFNADTSDNDICLVKLAAPVNFTANIQKIDLASENITFNVGTISWTTVIDFSSTPATLQEVEVSVIGNDQCNSYSGQITKNMMCTGIMAQFSLCQGAALVTKQGSTWIQIGILISENFEIPYVYTRVSQYQKWINDTVTGMRPGFVTFSSPGNDSHLNYTYPTPAPTTSYSTNYHQPTTNYPQPTTNYPQPTTNYPQHTTNYPQPTTNYHQPTTNYPQPTTNYHQPTTNYPQHTTNYPQPTTNYHHSATDNSIFGSGEALIPITRFFPLSILLLLLHLFVGAAGI